MLNDKTTEVPGKKKGAKQKKSAHGKCRQAEKNLPYASYLRSFCGGGGCFAAVHFLSGGERNCADTGFRCTGFFC